MRVEAPLGWYDWFSMFYDLSLERRYAPHRQRIAEALALVDGDVVVDVPTGTGQSLAPLVEGVGATGFVVGVDPSTGMLGKARQRATRAGWERVGFVHGTAEALTLDALHIAGAPSRPTALVIAFGMTVFPDPDATFAHLWDLLAPGGRVAILDVHPDRRDLFALQVELVAQADLTRRWWEPLEARCEGFRKDEVPWSRLDGGRLEIAFGRKPN